MKKNEGGVPLNPLEVLYCSLVPMCKRESLSSTVLFIIYAVRFSFIYQ